tara:strand:+ start:449 stop:601 length:153 start_codon:yes stop_codon:yes gene_type:complete
MNLVVEVLVFVGKVTFRTEDDGGVLKDEFVVPLDFSYAFYVIYEEPSVTF